jgi:hypothetical protein
MTCSGDALRNIFWNINPSGKYQLGTYHSSWFRVVCSDGAPEQPMPTHKLWSVTSILWVIRVFWKCPLHVITTSGTWLWIDTHMLHSHSMASTTSLFNTSAVPCCVLMLPNTCWRDRACNCLATCISKSCPRSCIATSISNTYGILEWWLDNSKPMSTTFKSELAPQQNLKPRPTHRLEAVCLLTWIMLELMSGWWCCCCVSVCTLMSWSRRTPNHHRCLNLVAHRRMIHTTLSHVDAKSKRHDHRQFAHSVLDSDSWINLVLLVF